MPEARVHIIGVAPEGAPSLSPSARRLIEQAEILLGGERLLQMFPAAGEKVTIKNNLAEVADLIRTNLGVKRMVVLASGDPNFFGIARYLTGQLGEDRVEITPNVSAMQVAFARVKENWDDAALVSAHARPIEDIVDTVRSARKIGILTDDRNTPAEIARVLLEHGVDDCQVHVCQDLGSDRERIVSTNLGDLSIATDFSPLSIMILIREDEPAENPRELLMGAPDDRFAHQRGLITKLEVRVVSLAKLGLNEHSVVWDIGAGSGAVSIEAAALASKGHVFAIEKDSECVANIRENIKRFNRHNITVVEGAAPEKLGGLSDPTAVFIGGSGGKMVAILACACRRLRSGGRIVINVTTLQNLHRAVAGLEANGFGVETTLVNIARSKHVSGLSRLEALNPVFIITGKRKKDT